MENAKHAAQERPIARRLVAFVTAVAACVALAAGGTLAYFSAEETAHNVITTGGVDIELVEKVYAGVDGQGNAVYDDFEDVSGVTPGQTVSKIVTVKNIGETDAWVRVEVAKAIDLAAGREGAVDLALVEIECDTAHWVDGGDGYWYYASKLAPGASTEPLFEAVRFLTTMDNLYQGSTVTVDVYAQAVQYKNNADDTDDVLKASGWPSKQ